MQLKDTPSIFAQLPIEIVRDIFEIAAQIDHRTALTLLLVSHASHKWTEPFLYHTVVLHSARELNAFIFAVSCKPAAFIQKHVRNLAIFALGPIQSIDRVLVACSGVKSLACGFSLPSYTHLSASAAPAKSLIPREQHLLGISCRNGLDTSVISPFVTHLRIHLTADTSPAPFLRLAELSLLTHLAIVYRQGLFELSRIQSMLQPVLDTGKLQLLLVQVAGSGSTSHLAEVDAWNESAVKSIPADDDEMSTCTCIVAERAPHSPLGQWEDALKGGCTVWDAAEKVLDTRRALRRVRGHGITSSNCN